MKIEKVVLIVPSFCAAGPIRGAVAIANGLCPKYQVTLIALKGVNIASSQLGLNNAVSLEDWRGKSWLEKYKALKSKYSPNTTFFSLCFSADIITGLLPKSFFKLTSIRADLSRNYSYDYGRVAGPFLASFHYHWSKKFNFVLAISDHMIEHLKDKNIQNVDTVYNFIDEKFLSKERSQKIEKKYTFVFIGGLNNRKKPLLLASAFKKMLTHRPGLSLCFIGDGPLRGELEKFIHENNLTSHITLKGHLSAPYSVIQEAMISVLPSTSEGVSRAILESLYLGVPCILRKREAAPEIINNANGVLFDTDDDLLYAMTSFLERYESADFNQRNLVPEKFGMNFNIGKLESLFLKLENR